MGMLVSFSVDGDQLLHGVFESGYMGTVAYAFGDVLGHFEDL